MKKAVKATLKPTWRRQGTLINKETGEEFQSVIVEQFRSEPDRVQCYSNDPTFRFFTAKVADFDREWKVEGVFSLAEEFGL